MRSLIFLSLLLLSATAFRHHAPGEACTLHASQLPAEANAGNTYDYIWVGSGGMGTMAAIKLALNTSCQAKILIIEAGRSYTKMPTDCDGAIDCYVKGTENYYHRFPSGPPYQVYQTRGTWAFVSREQVYSNAVAYSDGRTTDCPYDPAEFIPAGCGCISDKHELFGTPCSVSQECLDQNGGDESLCGERACIRPAICAVNKTNLYWRASAKGGSHSHHFMVTYPQSPSVAAEFVEASGDSRYTFENWMRVSREIDENHAHLSYTINKAKAGTSANDTLKWTLQLAGIAEGLNDLSIGPNRFTNTDEFFAQANLDRFFSGYITDQETPRQVNRNTGERTFPSNYLDDAMETCPSTLTTLCNAFVTQILFDDRDGIPSRTAIGVEYATGTNIFSLDFNYNKAASDAAIASPTKAFARKGIIIANGAFASPGTLMRAGLGPTDHLAEHGIALRKHLPAVGQNMVEDNEHTIHWRLTATGDPRASARTDAGTGFSTYPYYVPDIIKRFWANDAAAFHPTTGAPVASFQPFQTMCHSGAVAFGGRACPTIPNSNLTIPEDPAYLAAYDGSENSYYRDSGFGVGASQMTFHRNAAEKASGRNPTCLALCGMGSVFRGWYDVAFHYGGSAGSYMLCDVLSSGMKSRGSVSLRSTNPADAMIVDPNALSHEDDVLHSGECVQAMRRIADRFNSISNANPSAHGGMQLAEIEHAEVPFLAPGDAVPRTGNPPEMVEFIKKSIWHHHPSATNRMGNLSDSNSVVDSRGRVWGTQNLYVMDMSSVPAAPDLFPSLNGMAFGFIQGEALAAHNPSESQTCNPNAFRGVQTAEQLDSSGDPYFGAVVGLGVTTGILGLIVLGGITAAAIRASGPYRQGYTTIQSGRKSRHYQ